MANAVAEGVKSAGEVEVIIKRVPELMPEDVAINAGGKLDQAVSIATVDELTQYGAIIFGTPTRFGNMSSQMPNFLDQTDAIWKVGGTGG